MGLVGYIFGGAMIGLVIGAIAGYLSKRYWVAGVVGASVCFVSVAPLSVRMGSAALCAGLIGLLALLKRSSKSRA